MKKMDDIFFDFSKHTGIICKSAHLIYNSK